MAEDAPSKRTRRLRRTRLLLRVLASMLTPMAWGIAIHGLEGGYGIAVAVALVFHYADKLWDDWAREQATATPRVVQETESRVFMLQGADAERAVELVKLLVGKQQPPSTGLN
jgi:hypothetical protein